MSVIARWWLIVGSDGHAYEVRNEQPDTSPEGIDFPFKDRVVEVAPVNQPPGAVEDFREIDRLLVQATIELPSERAVTVERAIAIARGHLGGQ